MRSKIKEHLLTVVLTLLFIFSGLEESYFLPAFFGFLTSLFLLISTYLKDKKRLKIPQTFYPFAVFLVTLFFYELAGEFRNKPGIYFMINFFSGGLFWIYFLNARKKISNSFIRAVIFSGLILSILFPLALNFDIKYLRNAPIYSFGLFNHFHIGDYMALVLIISVWSYLKKKKMYFLLIILLSFYILTLSFSRSALVSCAVGFGFLFLRGKNKKLVKKYSKPLIFILIAVFLYFGSKKTILFTRPYYIQALWGIANYPFGLGIGRFGAVSADPGSHLFGLSGYASITFNIVLEVLSGMGVWGITFMVWFFYLIARFFQTKGNILFGAIFLAITANFFFNNTYFTPTFVWVWFASLGAYMNDSGKL